MKCDELKRKYSDITGPYYGYNEVNEAIEELRTSHHKERDEYISMVHSREQTIKELKKKLDEKESWVKMLGEGEAALSLELEKTKQKLENVQASMYCDVVDANMENRRLKEERRWRKFSDEKPEHHQWILVFYPNHSQFTTGVELRRWDDGCKYDVEVQEIYEKWMPLPEPPKEADK